MSIKLRLIISSLFILVFFIIGTGYTLDKAFYTAHKTSLQEQLNTQLYLLMAATEIDESNTITTATSLLESKFSLPSSGLYAYITDNNNTILWRSLSVIGMQTPSPISLAKGKQEFRQLKYQQTDYHSISYGVNWLAGNNNIHITFNVQTDMSTFNQQILDYQTTLWTWLASMALILLIVLSLVLYWGLAPLRKVEQEMQDIENGLQETIEGQYPVEIQLLSTRINQLIEHAKTRQNRYKNALGDLAHSLKTPLAVIRSLTEGLTKNDVSQQLDEHITKIDSTIQYQLQRATSMGKSLSKNSVPLKPSLERIINTLNKVHIDKNVKVHNALDDSDSITISEDDILELFGNLLENAYKWSTSKISISCTIQAVKTIICIEDDGPGIAADNRKKILERGFRADTTTPGHGIGLAIVQDILSMHDSELEISQSDLGGAKICVVISN